jgi:hypothetical protein
LDTEDVTGTEEISSEQHQDISDDVKFKLQCILQLHEQDIDVLVQDARPIRSTLTEVRNLLTPELALVLTPAAYVEGFQPLVLEGKRRIADRAARQDQKERDMIHAKEIKGKNSDIKASSALISMELDRLKTKEADLLKELQKTWEASETEIARLERTPALINQAEDEYSAFTCQGRLHHNASKSIPGCRGSTNDR